MHNFRLASCSLLLILALGSASRAQDNPGDETAPAPPNGHPFDWFGKISWEDEKDRLDSFAIAILQSPDWVGQILIYAGRKACAGEAQARAMRMKNYLVKRRDIEPQRIVLSDAGHLENPRVVFWLAPRDKLLPLSRPDSIAAKDVQIINCKSKKQRRAKR